MPSARIGWVGGQEADRETLERLLRGAGLPEPQFLTASEAIAAIAGHDLDLILLDLMQKSSDVFDVLKAAVPVNNPAARLPVIVTAPNSVPERVQACLQRGAEDFLTTPIDPGNPLLITRRIKFALHRRELREVPLVQPTHKLDPKDTATLQLYTDVSSRFVPREFLENLQRSSLADVKLGDHVQRSMTVFFSDIRDFTALSEKLTPQQNFNFLNSYLKEVTPVIRGRRGFIDKYIGDAIMALFPHSPQDAMSAAVEVQRAVAKYNYGRMAASYSPIRIGIGMHCGDLILGTIGEEERMQTTVISDVVNLASRLEGLTKTFGATLLVSGAVVEGLDQGHAFKLRRLSAVRAKGKTQSVELYECFDNDPDDLVEHKTQTLEAFNAGMEEFRKGLFLTAGKFFARIAQMNPRDTVAAHYRDSCTMSAVRDRGRAVWDGAEKIEVK